MVQRLRLCTFTLGGLGSFLVGELRSYVLCGMAKKKKRVENPAALTKVKNPHAMAGDARDSWSIPRCGRPPGGGNGNPLQHSCLEDPMGERGLVGYSPRGRKSRTRLSD